MAKQTPHQKAWSTRRANAKKAAVKKLTAHQKAWATRRANEAAAVVVKPAKKVASPTGRLVKKQATAQQALTPTPSKWKCWAGPVKQAKLVKGLIKTGHPTTAELAGVFTTPTPVYVAPKPVTPTYSTVLALYSGRPDRWIKGRAATNANGASVLTTAYDASRFCLSAAVERVYPAGYPRTNATQKLNNVIKQYSLGTTHDVVSFNDRTATTFEDILRVLTIAGV